MVCFSDVLRCRSRKLGGSFAKEFAEAIGACTNTQQAESFRNEMQCIEFVVCVVALPLNCFLPDPESHLVGT